MSLVVIVLASAAVLFIAYRGYGGLLARLFRLDPRATTPAVAFRDDVDFVPAEPRYLLNQHFSAIAAAGPIVGPILAGVMFGWLPALLWILLGSIFIGGVHDLAALTASLRHRARSIAEVVNEHMSRRSYMIFLAFIWLALIYIIVAFTDITASSFVGAQTLENGRTIRGGGIATSSLLYLALPIIMGLLMRYARLGVRTATAIFVPLIGVIIWAGQYLPLDLAALLGTGDAGAQKIWDVALLLYCLGAAVVPVWLLLQPRGYLGGVFMFVALFGGALGLVFGGKPVAYPAFTGWTTARGDALFPMLFITIACGACSGFHALIASGTTSKQVRRETDAKLIGYGTMLLEGMVAVVSLCCVMMLAQDSPLVANPKPNFIYAQGIGAFLHVIGVPAAFGISFALMAFTTFVYDTLDVCTRLGRYILQELTGARGARGRWISTAVTALVPLGLLLRTPVDAQGHPVPIWRTFWGLFGASNQLLAALTLLGVTVWLWRTRRARWVWLVTGIPTLWMYVMSVWALTTIVMRSFRGGITADPVPWIGLLLVLLAVMMLIEALRILVQDRTGPRASDAMPAVTGV